MDTSAAATMGTTSAAATHRATTGTASRCDCSTVEWSSSSCDSSRPRRAVSGEACWGATSEGREDGDADADDVDDDSDDAVGRECTFLPFPAAAGMAIAPLIGLLPAAPPSSSPSLPVTPAASAANANAAVAASSATAAAFAASDAAAMVHVKSSKLCAK